MGWFTLEIKPTKESAINVILTDINYEGGEVIQMADKKGL
jgi:hypothetical protein